MNDINLQTLKLNTVGRAASLARIPLQLLAVAGLVAKIAVKAIVFTPFELIGNGFRWAVTPKNKTFEYLSPTGSDAEGFAKDFQKLGFIKHELGIALDRFIFAPNKEEYSIMSLSNRMQVYSNLVFTNSADYR